jgi:hypothetical protein
MAAESFLRELGSLWPRSCGTSLSRRSLANTNTSNADQYRSVLMLSTVDELAIL